MTSTEPRSDRQNLARYADVANALHLASAAQFNIAAAITPDQQRYDTFAEPVARILRQGFEQIGRQLAEAAAQCDDMVGTYRELVTGDAA